MFADRNGKSPRACCVEDPLDPEVELVVAEARRVEPPRVLDVDRRHVVEQRRVRRRRADVVAGRQQQRPPGQRVRLLVEHRRELAGAADARRRARRSSSSSGRAGRGSRSARRSRAACTSVPSSSRSRRTTPWLCCGAGMSSRNAAVGARSMLRTPRRCRARSPSPPARNVARMFVLRLEVLHVGHVAVLAEERRARDQRAGRRRVELVRRRGEHDEVAGARRMRHVGRAVPAPFGMYRASALVKARSITFQPSGCAVAGPVVGVRQREERRLDLRDRARPPGRRAPAASRGVGRVAAREVEVDLHRAAGPARLRLADRLTGRRAAVGGLRRREQPEVDEHLARVDRRELRRRSRGRTTTNVVRSRSRRRSWASRIVASAPS